MITDIQAEENRIGQNAARSLKRQILALMGEKLSVREGIMRRGTTVRAQMKYGRLDRLVIESTKVSFIQNFGFEGTKKNGIAMSLKASKHLTLAIEDSSALERLATQLANLRGDEVTNVIRF